ncbi:MAG: ATP-binding protein [Pseudomonadota bacterium]
MTQATQPINNIAPLANVVRLQTLAVRLQNRAHGLPGIGCFFSPAGYGKSTAGIFVTNSIGACHIQALPFGGTKGLLTMIVNELGEHPKRNIHDLFQQAADKLQKTGKILIIDEADQILTDRTIEMLRLLHDATEASLILMGEELLPQKLRAWERVHSRILSWVAAEAVTLEDIGFLAPIYAAGVTIDTDLRMAVLEASRGSIRNASTNLAYISEFAASKGLKKLSRADWGQKPFHTGEAPTARAQLGVIAARPRRAVA